MKTCKTCSVEKPLPSFSAHNTAKDGLNPCCIMCIRERNRQWRLDNPERARTKQLRAYLRSTYGLTIEDYDKLVEAQGGVCAICYQPERLKNGRLCVDHDHTSGKIRGLLCTGCNVSIGRMNDDPAQLRRAAEYLEQSSVS